MKVLMVGPYPPPGKNVSGGVERVIDSLLPSLGRRVELTLVVPNAATSQEVFCDGVRIIYLKRIRGFGFINYWSFDARKIRSLANQLSPDVVHVQGVGGWGWLVRHPRILTIHGIAHRDVLTSARAGVWGSGFRKIAASVVKAVERRARHAIGGLIVINPYVLDEYPDARIIRSWLIPNPLDQYFVNALPGSELNRAKNIVIVGKVCNRKNTLEGVQIACQLLQEDPEAVLSVAGDVSDREYLELCQSVSRNLGVESRTHFLGNLDTKGLVRVLDHASVMLMTSQQETAPMAIVEAHSRGVPVVAPESFGIKTMIVPGCNGYFLAGGDIKKSVSILREALSRDWARAQIAESARQAYSVESVVERTVQAYQEIVDH